MSCSDCWEWLVDLVVRHEEADLAKESEELNSNTDSADGPQILEPGGFHRDRLKQLYNRHGFNLAIFPGGNVRGVRDAFHANAVLEVIPQASVGEVRIRGLETGLYLAMDKDGKLHAVASANDDTAVFVESVLASYFVYKSKLHSGSGWHVGLKQNGDPKSGSRTVVPWAQKGIQFAHRRAFPQKGGSPYKQMVNRNGLALAIQADGKVQGVAPTSVRDSLLEFTPSHPPGAYRIRGVESNLFLCMDDRGGLYGEKTLKQGTLFSEHAQGPYMVYLSVQWAHLGWHVGIKRSGKAKKGERTWHPQQQKATQFVHKYPTPHLPSDLSPLGESFPPLAFIDEDDDDV